VPAGAVHGKPRALGRSRKTLARPHMDSPPVSLAR